jgi:hypothetical protein
VIRDALQADFRSLLAEIHAITGHGQGRVTFKTVRNSEDDWTIVAEYPGADPKEITGLKNKTDVGDWMNGDRRVAWLRS